MASVAGSTGPKFKPHYDYLHLYGSSVTHTGPTLVLSFPSTSILCIKLSTSKRFVQVLITCECELVGERVFAKLR
jgi:hypothetical protein